MSYHSNSVQIAPTTNVQEPVVLNIAVVEPNEQHEELMEMQSQAEMWQADAVKKAAQVEKLAASLAQLKADLYYSQEINQAHEAEVQQLHAALDLERQKHA